MKQNMKLFLVAFLAVSLVGILSDAAVIDVREEEEVGDGSEVQHVDQSKAGPVRSDGGKARNKIEAMDRTLNQIILAIDKEAKLLEKSLERRLDDIIAPRDDIIAPLPHRSCDAKNRSKRFLNPLQIFHSLFDEGLDHPKIPYVNSPAPALSLYNVFGDGEDEEEEIGRADFGKSVRPSRSYDAQNAYSHSDQKFFHDGGSQINPVKAASVYLDGEDETYSSATSSPSAFADGQDGPMSGHSMRSTGMNRPLMLLVSTTSILIQKSAATLRMCSDNSVLFLKKLPFGYILSLTRQCSVISFTV